MENWRIGALCAGGTVIVAVLFFVFTGGGDDDLETSADTNSTVSTLGPTQSLEVGDLELNAVPRVQDGTVPQTPELETRQTLEGTSQPTDTATATETTATTAEGNQNSNGNPTAAPAPANRDAAQFEGIRNTNPLFNRFENVPETQLDRSALTEDGAPFNGAYNDGVNGAFRLACNYSHFSYDDPIVFPNQPGKSHMHMFFGNTKTDAFSTTESLTDSGGGSCQGFELNRSAYWTPTVLDGKGNIIVPDQIILYYKTKNTGETKPFPQGLKMIAGNPTGSTFTTSDKIQWACGGSGHHTNQTNRIPTNCGSEPVNFSVKFPQCWNRSLESADHISHMTYINDNESCPSSHPVRLPQITFLVYFPGGMDTNSWYLSSDDRDSLSGPPGGTLHVDWFGAWHEETVQEWTTGCLVASKNCSFGQTGTSRNLASLNGLEQYMGDNAKPLP